MSDNEESNETASDEGQGNAPAAEEPTVDPLEAAQAEAKKNLDGWKRTAADFDNFRKRSRRELEDTRKAGREELLKDFLPVFDNLERAIQSAQRATEIKPVVEGLSMVLKQYIDTLGRAGVSKVPGVGKMFDPMVHEAIQQVESDEPIGTIVAEVQPGYLNGERLVRAAMVVVAKAKAETTEPAADEAESASPEEGEAEAAKESDAEA